MPQKNHATLIEMQNTERKNTNYHRTWRRHFHFHLQSKKNIVNEENPDWKPEHIFIPLKSGLQKDKVKTEMLNKLFKVSQRTTSLNKMSWFITIIIVMSCR